jgi:hypothetical protein
MHDLLSVMSERIETEALRKLPSAYFLLYTRPRPSSPY